MKLYKDNGFLSEDGKEHFDEFLKPTIADLLNKGETPDEVQLISSLIKKLVGDLTLDTVVKLKENK